MTKERFSEILKEYDFTDRQIKLLWDSRPSDDLDEEKLRKKASLLFPILKHIAPVKDKLVQT